MASKKKKRTVKKKKPAPRRKRKRHAGRPAAVRSSALKRHTPEERAQLREWGRQAHVRGNPPTWVVDEKAWERAKAAVRPHWETYREPWAVVARVYENIRAAQARGK